MRATTLSASSLLDKIAVYYGFPSREGRISSLFGSSRATLMPSRDSPVHTGDEEIR